MAAILLLSFAAMADEPAPALVVRSGYLVTKDGKGMDVGAGCWMDTRQCVATGKRLAKAEAKVEVHETMDPAMVAAFAGMVLAAGLTGFALGRLGR